MLGPQHQHFAPEVLARLVTESVIVSAQRDRMAMVLDGPRLPAIEGHDIVSDGTVNGSIQVPGNGQPIVLLADRQTMGGYPVLGWVHPLDLGLLAQSPAHRVVRFERVKVGRVQEELRAFYRFFGR